MRFTKNIPIYMSAFSAAVFVFASTKTTFAATACQNGDAAACLNEGTQGNILGFVVLGLNFLAASVGIAAVIMLIVAGIQYSAAADNPQAVQAAKQRIYNVVIGLVTFFLLWGFLQWLIPGGIGVS